MASSPISVPSPVAGTVLRIEVSAGQAVQAGDLLATIESMKMEIPVEAEQAGTIVDIAVQASARVDEDQALFRLQPA
ncbi:acetyl-CoA carboxylase biotin carboxyl carrier protein subunit [Bordetella petrii]|uniref:acetyl-CoA carboxylase biotin carboxyl carrier protein subunit n=1 Tax=Bordetella petrii TaxID=94624 RepID=UPI001E4EC7B1|nr:acetyl-CoA carboxylase biotin carboxyl carrier protein subunit [Bordetella petrii]MCD0501682.1 acetyl-CoA carboxylase biotin carboxyl carrier protein subunit [Bordetella petrii]